MKDKVRMLRKNLIEELKNLDDGMIVSLTDKYDSDILELILFSGYDGYDRYYPSIDEYGNRAKCKKFALPNEILRKIDFSNVSFDNFDAKGYDFTGLHLVNLNPQKVYNKNFENSILSGVCFTDSFDGCKIGETDFTGSIGAKIDPDKIYYIYSRVFGKEIWMPYCKFDGVTFTKIIKLKAGHINGCDFTGSIGAKIYLNGFKNLTNINNCNFKDVTFIGTINNFDYLDGISFSGAKSEYGMVRINPERMKSLTKCNFDGVRFIKPIGKCNISGSNFTGSKGAKIDLRKITNFSKTNFTDAKVIGYNGEKVMVTQDGRIVKSLEDKLDNLLGLGPSNKILSKKELEDAKKKLIDNNRRLLKGKIQELLKLVSTSEKLGMDPKNLYASIPIDRELFLVWIDDHYEINREIIDLSLLRFLNLSLINFDNVMVSGIDFRHTNARINPQTVYKKDLSNATFDNGNIKFFDDFTGVNIENTDFTECEIDNKILKKIYSIN